MAAYLRISDQLQKDRQIVLRVLRVDRRVPLVDRRVLRVDKRVLRIGEEYYE